MSAYAIAVIRDTDFNDEVADYLRKIDATLAPYGGKYVIHGGPYERLEGTWEADLVVIQFPSFEMAQAWYGSDAYQAIRPLRTANTEGDVFLVRGVPQGHKAADILT